MPRFNRTAVALCAVLAFVGLVIFSGRPFGNDVRAGAPPSVPASGADTQSAEQPPSPQFGAPPTEKFRPAAIVKRVRCAYL